MATRILDRPRLRVCLDHYAGQLAHRDRPTVLAFSPRRPLLFSGSMDTTVLAWDLRVIDQRLKDGRNKSPNRNGR